MFYQTNFVEDYHRSPTLSGEYKCAAWTGKQYETFYFKSDKKPHSDALYQEAWRKCQELYGIVERIVCVLPA